MTRRLHLLILALQLSWGVESRGCDPGFTRSRTKGCIDTNECEPELDGESICGPNAACSNTNGSYNCTCSDGFVSSDGKETFIHGEGVTCEDINECRREHGGGCGPNATCKNTLGSYICTCSEGFVHSGGKKDFKGGEGVKCEDVDECESSTGVCGQDATCSNTPGSYRCVCQTGFTNYGDRQSRCTELNCDMFALDNLETLPRLQEVVTLLRKRCSELRGSETPRLDGEALLETLLSMIDDLLDVEPLEGNREVTFLLESVENALRLIGATLESPRTRRSCSHAEVELQVRRAAVVPRGPVTLTSAHARLNSTWETAAGDDSSYPGFATASLLSYRDLETSTEGFYEGVRRHGDDDWTFQVNSKVVTVTVSNRNAAVLEKPYRVEITLMHLNKSAEGEHVCVFWDPALDGGAGSWSERGCVRVESGPGHTVCSCSHLSSFAVLLALYDVGEVFELQLLTWVGLSLSLLCLALCVLTFSLCRSLQSTRNTIHLHLSLSLLLADLVFLAGISRTENRVGCGVVAGLLHFLFLSTFSWMFLEGVQLFRMVVLVFNTTVRTLHMMAAGYGVPALIVVLSAAVHAEGYGTKRYCWLNWEDGFIWSFFGPVCFIIIVNVFFFLITVWKLAQKFSSLNPDLTSLYKIKAFTTTAVAQLCVLGTMWIFGCFQFGKNTIALSYLFTILNSLQGVLMFTMHCLLSKPVREEYAKLWSSVRAPQKKKYTHFSTSQSSKSQSSKSGQNTGESQI